MARIIVGECPSCGRPLRVKTTGVKGTMNLTCRCGTSTRVKATAELQTAARKAEQKPLTSVKTIKPERKKREVFLPGRDGLKNWLFTCRWLLGFYTVYLVGLGSFILLGKLGAFNNAGNELSALFFMAISLCCTGLIGSTVSAYKHAESLHRDGGRWGLFVFLFAFLAPLILAVMPERDAGFSSIFSSGTEPAASGSMEIGPRCMNCGKAVNGCDQIMASQSHAVQAGLTQKARDMEKDQGYVCLSCGNIYCKVCLEGRVPDSQKGADCPTCGGSFGYLP